MDLINQLKKNGYRVTTSREIICKILEETGHEHFTADKLFKYIESDLNVIFVFANEAIEQLSTDMTCRREYFNFPIREAWLKDTPKKEKISRAVNILLHKKLRHRNKEYIIHKDVIKNTEWDPNHKWKKNRMNIGLRMETNEGTTNLSHSMIQMKETSALIILLRYLKKYTDKEI